MAFAEDIMTMLHAYKRALKRYLAPEDRELKIQMLDLDRKSIKLANETELYKKAHAIIADIKTWTENQNESPTAYSGIEEFSNKLLNLLNQYHIETDVSGEMKVVHTQQLVSRAMVDAIQLLTISPEDLLGKRAYQLDCCFQIIAKYGTKEQREILMKMLQQRNQRHQKTIFPLFNSFLSYLQTK